ncbi:hypothetical protein SKC41_26195 [Mycobacterium sp. 050128]|uniref:hypothetical protein n=1 Tax=Mycobacterium sp. 050128 TaxID=3096112 RepID=UPI002ED9A401
MWCPSVSLSVWANAWLAGKAAPDDVLDALSLWAPKQSVTAYDAVAAGHTGLPWPDIHDAGTVSLLQTLRAAVGRVTPPGTAAAPGALRGTINVVLPVPGDVRGLAPGTQFERDALAAGEAVIITHPDDPTAAVGLVPECSYADLDDTGDDEPESPELCALAWTVYSVPGAPVFDHHELGDAEYSLRSAVRSAADALGAIGLGSASDIDDPRGLVEQLLEFTRQHRIPDHAPSRALRVLENAAHVDAIITVSSGLSRASDAAAPDRFAARVASGLEPVGTQSSSEARIAGDALRPLNAVVRSARMAAVNAIMHSAWAD